MIIDRRIDCFVVQFILISGYGNNYVQPPKQLLVPAKAFSYQSFQSIAVNGALDPFTRNGQAQARIFKSISAGDEQKFSIFRADGRTKNLSEVVRVCQSVPSGKAATVPEHGRYYTVSLFRPLALRVLITLLPPLVRILVRKPCWRFRFNLLG